MSDNIDDAKGKAWSIRAAIRRAQKYKDDPEFKKQMGDNYADFLHWLAVTDKKLEEFYDDVEGITHPDMPPPPCCIVASAPTAGPPAGSLLLDLEGPVGVALVVGVALLTHRDRPQPIPSTAVTSQQKLDYACAQLRATLPVELAFDFMTNDIVDVRVTVGMAARDAAREAAKKAAAASAANAAVQNAVVKATDHATEVLRYGVATAAAAAATGATAEDLKQLEKQLGDALGIDKVLPAIGIVTAISTRIKKLMPDGMPPQCKEDYTEYSRAMGRVNNAIFNRDFGMVKKSWPSAVKSALKVIACLKGGGSGGTPTSGASGTPAPATP